MKTIMGSMETGFVEVDARNAPDALTVSDGEFAALQMESVMQRRAWLYDEVAPIFELADAEAKMSSEDEDVRHKGLKQKEALLARRLRIKEELPKP